MKTKKTNILYTTNGCGYGPCYAEVWKEGDAYVAAVKRHDVQGLFRVKRFSTLREAEDYAVQVSD